MAIPKKKTVKKKTATKDAVQKKMGNKQAAVSKGAGKTAASKKAAAKRTSTKPAKRSSSPAHGRTAPIRAGLLNIDYSLCKGCGGCADAFPRFFEMRGDLAWVINAEGFDPRRDSGILSVCPYYAIMLE